MGSNVSRTVNLGISRLFAMAEAPKSPKDVMVAAESVNIMESLKLWLALTPPQFEALNKGEMVEPDEYSKRFGLRKTPEAAIERAKYFMEWTPRDVPEKEKRDPKEYVLVEVELTALGYMQKCEAGILLKYKPNEYRWQGNMQAIEYDSMGRLLYRFGSEAFAVE